LSSQRTTTHRKPTAEPCRSPPGHSFNLTRAISHRQIRSAFAKAPTTMCTTWGRVHWWGSAGRPLRISPPSSVSLPARRTLPGRLRVAKSGPPSGFRRPHRPVLPPGTQRPRWRESSRSAAETRRILRSPRPSAGHAEKYAAGRDSVKPAGVDLCHIGIAAGQRRRRRTRAHLRVNGNTGGGRPGGVCTTG
jgi:hypothetical protein